MRLGAPQPAQAQHREILLQLAHVALPQSEVVQQVAGTFLVGRMRLVDRPPVFLLQRQGTLTQRHQGGDQPFFNVVLRQGHGRPLPSAG